MSEATRFHTTEALLLEREQLHRLVDYFWQTLPNTRDEVYKMLSTSLSLPDIHISDMSSEQIKTAAEYFWKKISMYAPCDKCARGRQTTYGLFLCESPYWSRPENAQTRCAYYVPRDISNQGPT